MSSESTPESRRNVHIQAADQLQAVFDHLMILVRRFAMEVHDEIEALYSRVEDINHLHIDPAAHGRDHHRSNVEVEQALYSLNSKLAQLEKRVDAIRSNDV